MNRSIALLALAFTAATAHAGSFGGPPPFSNGSPLTSGVDGSYQASVRGSNLSGVIRFAFSSQVQTATVAQNTWAIFYEGRLYTGTPQISIENSKITGVLSSTAHTNPAEITTGALPTNALITGQNLAGQFTAKSNLKSPTADFKGKGTLSVTLPPQYTYDLNIPISQPAVGSISQGVPNPSNTPATSPGGLTSAPFKITGTRNTTSGS